MHIQLLVHHQLLGRTPCGTWKCLFVHLLFVVFRYHSHLFIQEACRSCQVCWAFWQPGFLGIQLGLDCCSKHRNTNSRTEPSYPNQYSQNGQWGYQWSPDSTKSFYVVVSSQVGKPFQICMQLCDGNQLPFWTSAYIHLWFSRRGLHVSHPSIR